MSRYAIKTIIPSLLAAALLAAPGAGTAAMAQEAITLETIGAVHMQSPAELRRSQEQPSAVGEARSTVGDETMWFADAYSTAYYTLDQNSHELVARFEAGPKGGHPIVVRRTLGDGAVERISVDGTGRNNIRATLIVSQKAGVLKAYVTTDLLPQQQASN